MAKPEKRNLTKSEVPTAVVQIPPFLLREAKGWRSGWASEISPNLGSQLPWFSLPFFFEGGPRVAERLGQRNLTKSGLPAAVVQPPPFLLREAKGWRNGWASEISPNLGSQLPWFSLPFFFEGGPRVAERLGQRNLTKSGFPAAVVQLPLFPLKEARGWWSGWASEI